MTIRNITVHDAHANQSEGFTYVDVRSVPEFASGHPENAVNVPLLHRDAGTGQMSPNNDFVSVMRANYSPDARLMIGCQVGGRSVHAAHILAQAGFLDIANVLGGFGGGRDPMTGVARDGWQPAGLPVAIERTPGQSYEAVRVKADQGK